MHNARQSFGGTLTVETVLAHMRAAGVDGNGLRCDDCACPLAEHKTATGRCACGCPRFNDPRASL